eukprot:Nk52_evm19s280 gene=Nk52_evmTU19s280
MLVRARTARLFASSYSSSSSSSPEEKLHIHSDNSNSKVGPELSSANLDAVAAFDKGVIQLYHFQGDPEAAAKEAIRHDSKFSMGYLLAVACELAGSGTKLSDKAIQNNLKKAEEHIQNASIREKEHLRACKAWGNGQMKLAAEIWESLLVVHHDDALAIVMNHYLYFYLGAAREMRDSIARVLPFWKKESPLYGYLLGMYAFGLEEAGHYALAEQNAKDALAINPSDAWAAHALAHVFEMRSHFEKGIEFLQQNISVYAKSNMLACHMYWHMAVFYIEQGDHLACADIYDTHIRPMALDSKAPLDMVDAAAILLRLEIDGYDVGKDRWQEIHDMWKPQVGNHTLLFNDVHIMMGFSQLGKAESIKKLLDSSEKFVDSAEGDSMDHFGLNNPQQTVVMRRLAKPLLGSLVAFAEKKYEKVVEMLLPIRYQIYLIGGSHAQRDIFNQLLIVSSIKSQKFQLLAMSLLAERKLLRPQSKQTDRFMETISKNCKVKNEAGKDVEADVSEHETTERKASKMANKGKGAREYARKRIEGEIEQSTPLRKNSSTPAPRSRDKSFCQTLGETKIRSWSLKSEIQALDLFREFLHLLFVDSMNHAKRLCEKESIPVAKLKPAAIQIAAVETIGIAILDFTSKFYGLRISFRDIVEAANQLRSRYGPQTTSLASYSNNLKLLANIIYPKLATENGFKLLELYYSTPVEYILHTVHTNMMSISERVLKNEQLFTIFHHDDQGSLVFERIVEGATLFNLANINDKLTQIPDKVQSVAIAGNSLLETTDRILSPPFSTMVKDIRNKPFTAHSSTTGEEIVY